MVENGTIDLCRDDPGRDVTLVVDSTVRALTEVWMGDCTPQEAMQARALRVDGNERDPESRDGGSVRVRLPRRAAE